MLGVTLPLAYALTHSPTCSRTYFSHTPLLTYSLTHLLTFSLTYSRTYLLFCAQGDLSAALRQQGLAVGLRRRLPRRAEQRRATEAEAAGGVAAGAAGAGVAAGAAGAAGAAALVAEAQRALCGALNNLGGLCMQVPHLNPTLTLALTPTLTLTLALTLTLTQPQP